MKWIPLILTLLLSACGSKDVTASSPQADLASPQVRGVTVRKVVALTGPEAPSSTRAVDLCSTDIGTMTELGGLVYYAFGDSFGYDGDNCQPFGPN